MNNNSYLSDLLNGVDRGYVQHNFQKMEEITAVKTKGKPMPWTVLAANNSNSSPTEPPKY